MDDSKLLLESIKNLSSVYRTILTINEDLSEKFKLIVNKYKDIEELKKEVEQCIEIGIEFKDLDEKLKIKKAKRKMLIDKHQLSLEANFVYIFSLLESFNNNLLKSAEDINDEVKNLLKGLVIDKVENHNSNQSKLDSKFRDILIGKDKVSNYMYLFPNTFDIHIKAFNYKGICEDLYKSKNDKLYKTIHYYLYEFKARRNAIMHNGKEFNNYESEMKSNLHSGGIFKKIGLSEKSINKLEFNHFESIKRKGSASEKDDNTKLEISPYYMDHFIFITLRALLMSFYGAFNFKLKNLGESFGIFADLANILNDMNMCSQSFKLEYFVNITSDLDILRKNFLTNDLVVVNSLLSKQFIVNSSKEKQDNTEAKLKKSTIDIDFRHNECSERITSGRKKLLEIIKPKEVLILEENKKNTEAYKNKMKSKLNEKQKISLTKKYYTLIDGVYANLNKLYKPIRDLDNFQINKNTLYKFEKVNKTYDIIYNKELESFKTNKFIPAKIKELVLSYLDDNLSDFSKHLKKYFDEEKSDKLEAYLNWYMIQRYKDDKMIKKICKINN